MAYDYELLAKGELIGPDIDYRIRGKVSVRSKVSEAWGVLVLHPYAVGLRLVCDENDLVIMPNKTLWVWPAGVDAGNYAGLEPTEWTIDDLEVVHIGGFSKGGA